MNSILNPIEPPKEDSGDFGQALIVGVAVVVVFGLGGFMLMKDKTESMGIALFVLLPIVTGFATALLVRGKNLVLASLVLGAIICTGVLIVTRVEGWVCVLMSSPLIVFGLAIGAILGMVGRHFLERFSGKSFMTLLMLAVLPFFLMGANRAEEEARRTPRAETFTNTLLVDSSRELAWNQLKTFDQIKGSKGLLMRIGLPVPVSCTMSGEGVGATRTCYFESGYIEERVTEWSPPTSMKFEITKFDVPGRPWLSFEGASYELREESGGTLITRKTTIVSRLSPAWYWRRMEKIGVETEHEYLFEEVKRKINGAK